jgi:lipopolysaccharide transport system ATP-binding protein
MGEVAKEGRTVLFVSHNMGAVETLCVKALYLSGGRALHFADSSSIITQYVNDLSEMSAVALEARRDRIGSEKIRATGIEVRSGASTCRSNVARTGDFTAIIVHYEIPGDNVCNNVAISIDIDDMSHTRILTMLSKFNGQYFSNLSKSGEFVCEIPELPLRTGSYLLNVYIEVNGELSDYIRNAYVLNVEYGKYYESGLEPVGGQGYLLQRFHWKME